MLTFFLVYAALGALPWIAAIILAVRRSLMAPVCCQCGARKVIRSNARRLRDILPLMSLMVPLTCVGCLARFYGVRGINPSKNKHAWETLPGYKPEVPVPARGSFFKFPQVGLRVRIAPLGRPAVATVRDTAFTSDLGRLQHALRTPVTAPAPAAAESTVSR